MSYHFLFFLFIFLHITIVLSPCSGNYCVAPLPTNVNALCFCLSQHPTEMYTRAHTHTHTHNIYNTMTMCDKCEDSKYRYLDLPTELSPFEDCREDEGETQRQLVDEHRSQFSRSSHDSVFILDRNRDTKAQLPLLSYDSRVHIKIPQADKSTEYSTSTKD